MNTETHKRAKKGGERGANGEWYEGGKFIATTDHAKELGSNNEKPTGRQEVEQGVWEVAPEGQRSIYSKLAGVEVPVWADGKIIAFQFNHDLRGDYTLADVVTKRQAMIESYNNGKRWI